MFDVSCVNMSGLIPPEEIPLDRPALEFLRKELDFKIQKLQETNQTLTDEIQNRPYSDELRELFETLQDNRDVIDQMNASLKEVRIRLGLPVSTD